MEKVYDVLQRLLPAGTNGSATEPSFECVPLWPPDAFAVAASLATYSGAFAQSRFIAHSPPPCDFDDAYRAEVGAAALEWSRSGTPPAIVQRLWQQMIEPGVALAYSENDLETWRAVMTLLAIADETCFGVGLTPQQATEQPASVIAALVLKGIHEYAAEEVPVGARPAKLLPWFPSSICSALIPSSECCVLPKTRTPQVGCTVRALTQNLALLPSLHEVRPNWLFAAGRHSTTTRPLNVLLIPYPFEVRGTSFQAFEERPRSPFGFHSLRQEWLDEYEHNGEKLARHLILPLLDEARREVDEVHAVVFPEAALSAKVAHGVSAFLAGQQIDMFITGVIDNDDGGGVVGRNVAQTQLYIDRKEHARWRQPKRHRWRVDDRQVRKYQLGNPFGHKSAWWEQIDVSDRNCYFYVYRRRTSMAVFVCEDLARLDAVQSVVRAIGPNLVIALLMDDIQLEKRWPGQYATVLADDPGCAVLTFTSLGLIRRAQMPGQKGPNVVALWKEPAGQAKELELPPDCRGLLLTLSHLSETNYTSDGRCDNGASVKISLTGVVGIKERIRKSR